MFADADHENIFVLHASNKNNNSGTFIHIAHEEAKLKELPVCFKFELFQFEDHCAQQWVQVLSAFQMELSRSTSKL